MSTQDDQRTALSRKRNILYLIDKFLTEGGFTTTAASLKNEAHLQAEYEICDNVDLDTMYLEYCSYFHMKFGKYPKIVKKINQSEMKPLRSDRKSARKRKDIQMDNESSVMNVKGDEASSCPLHLTDTIQIMNISKMDYGNSGDGPKLKWQPLEEHENYCPEWKDLADIVCRDLIKKDYKLKWSNIFGNSQAIAAIKEAVLIPLEFPHLFSDTLTPWKAILLHGPPGIGKTLIAKTLCSETFGKVAFFNVCSSTVISKWRGESEKIIRVLFDVAKFYAPSIIFVDEIEGLTSRRDNSYDHEASKRFKNEFLSLLDGIEDVNKGIFILANTNLPWEIDPAFLRRFEKKILIELPSNEERKQIINFFLPESKKWPTDVLRDISEKSEGFTGDELRIACKDATMTQIRGILSKEAGRVKQPTIKSVSVSDLKASIEQIKPSGLQLINKHIEWNKLHGNK